MPFVLLFFFRSRILCDSFSLYPQEFLKKEFSEENVLFWLACEDFKKMQDKTQVFPPLCNHSLDNCFPFPYKVTTALPIDSEVA